MPDQFAADNTVFTPNTVGPYRIESELGAGAMGTVYRAIHTGLERPVALKILRRDILEDEDAVRRFLREARSIARLEHPNIVSVYDAGTADGMYYIAMKLLEGTNLQALLARGKLPLDRTISIGTQLAAALDYAHEQDVVHLDVKPANVMVGSGDRIILTDFGIAQAVNPGATRSATISGTPLYMSPEQIQGQPVDRRSDIYSLGVMLYEMFLGRPPFQGQFVTVMYAHLHTPLPDMLEQDQGLPRELVPIVQRATAKDPRDRYQSAGDVARALSSLVPGETIDLAGTVLLDRSRMVPVTRPPQAQRSTRKLWIVAAAIVALAIIAGVAAFVLRGQGATTGTLTIDSRPAGATVSVDGVARGHTPVQISKVTPGKHRLVYKLMTYRTATFTVVVAGGKTASTRASLVGLPPSTMVQVTKAGLTTSLRKVGSKFQVGPPLTVIRAGKLQGMTIWAAAEMRVRPSSRGLRDVSLSPLYKLYAPAGALVTDFPKSHIIANKRGDPVAYASAVRLSSRSRLPAGRWHVTLVVGSQVVRTLSFQVTQ